jgi:hypothetical protein
MHDLPEDLCQAHDQEGLRRLVELESVRSNDPLCLENALSDQQPATRSTAHSDVGAQLLPAGTFGLETFLCLWREC